MKQFHKRLILALAFTFGVLIVGCDKSTSPTGGTTTGSVDAALVGVWFNKSDSSGSEIKADGKFIPLELGQNNFLVAVNIGTNTYTLSATGGSYTLTSKTKVEGTTRDTTITLKGTYTVNATTLTTTDPSGTTTYKKSAYGVNVLTPGGGGGGGGGFTTAGTISFSSDIGNFTATGIYNENATTGSGAGAFTQSSAGGNTLTIYGYRVNSATSIDITVIQFMNSAPIATGSFVFPSTGSKSVTVLYFPANNPNDTTENFYLLSTATANISAISASNAQGTFSGNGMYSANPSNTIAVTSGTFNVPVMPLITLNVLQQPIDNKIERVIKRIMSSK